MRIRMGSIDSQIDAVKVCMNSGPNGGMKIVLKWIGHINVAKPKPRRQLPGGECHPASTPVGRRYRVGAETTPKRGP